MAALLRKASRQPQGQPLARPAKVGQGHRAGHRDPTEALPGELGLQLLPHPLEEREQSTEPERRWVGTRAVRMQGPHLPAVIHTLQEGTPQARIWPRGSRYLTRCHLSCHECLSHCAAGSKRQCTCPVQTWSWQPEPRQAGPAVWAPCVPHQLGHMNSVLSHSMLFSAQTQCEPPSEQPHHVSQQLTRRICPFAVRPAVLTQASAAGTPATGPCHRGR